jgi:hypothetical protein
MGAMSSVALGVPIPVNRERTRRRRRPLLTRGPDLGQQDAPPIEPLAGRRRANLQRMGLFQVFRHASQSSIVALNMDLAALCSQRPRR